MKPVSILLALLIAASLFADSRSTVPPTDLRHNTPTLHALVNAKVIVAPGQVIERGAVIFSQGVIVAVGAGMPIPPDARVHDMTGRFIYPGLIEPYSEPAASESPRGSTTGGRSGSAPAEEPVSISGPAHWNAYVTPELAVERTYRPDPRLNKELRSQGVVARLAAPARGIIRGTGCVVSTSDAPASQAVIRTRVAQHVALTPSRNRFAGGAEEERYPASPMGAFTLVRQTLYDAQWYKSAWAAHAANRKLPAPERNAALDALAEQIDAGVPLMIDAPDELYALRAGRIAAEFAVPVIIRGSGQEYRRLAEIAGTKLPVVVPVNFPRPPNVASPEAAANATLADLMDWDLSPDNPARLHEAGVTIALTGHGLSDRADFLKHVRRAVARGLPPDLALAAMTTVPARLLGVERALGSLEPGKRASLLIADGELFNDQTKVLETWVDGERFDVAGKPIVDARGTWIVAGEVFRHPLELQIEGEPPRLKASIRLSPGDAPRADSEPSTTAPATRPAAINASHALQQDSRVSMTFRFDALGGPGIAQFSAIFADNEARGVVVDPAGVTHSVTLRRTAPPGTQPTGERRARRHARNDDSDDTDEPPATQPARASYPVNYPLGDFGRAAQPVQPPRVLFRNATVWTATGAPPMESTDVRVESGRIVEIGRNLPASPDAIVIDCTGRHLSPGIIDCHSHMATDGGVNEGGQNITAEVRIEDFIDPDDINIYRQLAAGVTCANILHGSANAIGGQNQVIKLRWGAGPEAMKLDTAPPGIKFALGENPRWANRLQAPDDARPPRYPQTRMGVAELIRNAFAAARDYRRAQQAHAADPNNHLPVRKDLELDALAEVLEHKRWIHCHSYRQDEILQFIRICDEFGVRIGTLQHVLEGYKVADEIARHGAMASSFSDWWAYKLEVYDAIPHNGALMAKVGVVVSFNSDDAELARRLHSEAAKAIKYGNVPPAQAIQFVTLNAARQLRIDDRVGSIEVGKDADLVVWNAPPMSTYAVAQQTWVDGRRYFDREEDLQLRARDAAMRQTLIQKILASGQAMTGQDEAPVRERMLWPRYDEACRHAHDDDE